jgi:hypothetical protein
VHAAFTLLEQWIARNCEIATNLTIPTGAE